MNIDLLTRGVLTMAAVTMFVLLGYGVLGDHKFSQNVFSISVMFVFPVLLGAGLCASIGMSRRIRVNLTIIIVSFMLAGYFAELIIWSVDKPVLSNGVPVASDVPARLEKLIELRKQGENIYAVTSISKFPREGLVVGSGRVIPLGYISNSRLISCGDSGEFPIYETDKYGFFNPPGSNHEAASIAIVGDSLAESTCVEKENNLLQIIVENGNEVLNFGRNGNGPIANLAVLKEYVSATKPKYVFWLHSADTDMSDLYGEKNHPILARYLDQKFSQNLRSRQTEVNKVMYDYFHSRYAAKLQQISAKVTKETKRSKSRAEQLKDILLFRHIWKRLRPLTRKIYVLFSGNDLEIFSATIKAAKSEIESWGGKLIFVYLPGTRLSIGKNVFFQRQRDWVLQFISSLGIPIVDLLPVIERHGGQAAVMFPVKPYPHFNEVGYRLIANEIIKYVENNR
jgi:hypothetical protein